MDKQKLFDELQDKENDLSFFKKGIATKLGWRYGCDFPDSCWRWVKEMKDGVTIATSLEAAIRFEQMAI